MRREVADSVVHHDETPDAIHSPALVRPLPFIVLLVVAQWLGLGLEPVDKVAITWRERENESVGNG